MQGPGDRGGRGSPRRQELLDAAVRLFHAQGFHATGIDEIGEAVGITGPAVYRHFRSKQEILEVLLRERGEAVVAASAAAVAAGRTPLEQLDRLARSLVEGVVHDPRLAVVATFERRTLGEATRRWLDRAEADNVRLWAEVARRARPALSEDEAVLVVHAALMLCVSVCNVDTDLAPEALVEVLHPMLLAAVLGPAAVAS